LRGLFIVVQLKKNVFVASWLYDVTDAVHSRERSPLELL